MHPRDSLIQFEENGHKYKIINEPNVKYMSVTTWVHSHFEPFDADKIIDKMMASKKWKSSPYFGKTKEEIKKQWETQGSMEGTKLHHDIEVLMKSVPPKNTHADIVDPCTNVSPEWSYLMDFIRDTPHLVPYRSEWVVFNEDLRISGTIDMVYENEDGSVMIYDWKRCKEISKNGWGKYALTESIDHIPDSNFWHYTLQLNMYRHILETKYDKNVSNMCLVQLHPIQKSYHVIPLPVIDVSKLF